MPTLYLLRNYNLSDDELQKLPQGCRGVLMETNKNAVIARADVPSYMSFSALLSLATAMTRAVPNAQIGYSERTLSEPKMIPIPYISWNIELESSAPEGHEQATELENFLDEINSSEATISSESQKSNSTHQEESSTVNTHAETQDIEDAIFHSGSYVAPQDITPTETKDYPMDVLDIEQAEIIEAEVVDEPTNPNPSAESFLDVPNSNASSSPKISKMTWWEMLDAGLARQAYETILDSELSIEEKGKLQFYFANKDPNILICLCRIAVAVQVKSLVMPISRKCFIHEHPQVRKEGLLAVGQLAGPSMEAAIRRMLKDPDQDVQKAAEQALEFLKGR